LKTEINVTKNSRLDKLLSLELQSPRNQIEKLIKDGNVEVNGKTTVKCGFKVEEKNIISINLPQQQSEDKKDIDFDINIIYEDEDILVINKPSSLIVHPAPSVKEATLVDWLINKNINLSTINGENRHGIVHRLDKDTTGVMVVAKNNESHKKLASQLEDKSMGRYYLAVVNIPLKDNITINKPIGRNRNNRLKMGYVHGAKEAKSYFNKIALSKDEKCELICAKLFTGRTHQIRVHLETINRKVLGDTTYGENLFEKHKVPRIFLHSYILYLIHPTTNEKVFFKAPFMSDMSNFFEEHFDNSLHKKIETEKIIKLFENM
jgi:23S rRNA pseudouridine1911/1915/1917 synthase